VVPRHRALRPRAERGVTEDARESGFDLYPPYVQTEEERDRWDAAGEVAKATSELHEASGVADNVFVWTAQRALYNSDIPTAAARISRA
jgi:hypothetical protein